MKFNKLLLALLLLLSVTVAPNCTHVHDETCGYDETTQECSHEHTDECFGVDPLGYLDPDGGGGPKDPGA